MVINIWLMLLFFIAVVSVYAIIISGKHRLITFFLTPLVLVGAIYSVYVVYAIQGTPKHEWPQGQIEIITILLDRPTIFLLVKHIEKEQPTYYSVDWSPEKASMLKNLLKNQSKGEQLQGEFKERSKGHSNVTIEQSIEFEPIQFTPLPPKEQ